jgi:hypothetical protein
MFVATHEHFPARLLESNSGPLICFWNLSLPSLACELHVNPSLDHGQSFTSSKIEFHYFSICLPSPTDRMTKLSPNWFLVNLPSLAGHSELPKESSGEATTSEAHAPSPSCRARPIGRSPLAPLMRARSAAWRRSRSTVHVALPAPCDQPERYGYGTPISIRRAFCQLLSRLSDSDGSIWRLVVHCSRGSVASCGPNGDPAPLFLLLWSRPASRAVCIDPAWTIYRAPTVLDWTLEFVAATLLTDDATYS